MQHYLLCTARHRATTEAAGEASEEEAAVVVWRAAAASGAADGVAATGLAFGGGLGGGSQYLTILMLSVADLFSSFTRVYKASISVHLGRDVVTFSTTPFYHLVSQVFVKQRLYSS